MYTILCIRVYSETCPCDHLCNIRYSKLTTGLKRPSMLGLCPYSMSTCMYVEVQSYFLSFCPYPGSDLKAAMVNNTDKCDVMMRECCKKSVTRVTICTFEPTVTDCADSDHCLWVSNSLLFAIVLLHLDVVFRVSVHWGDKTNSTVFEGSVAGLDFSYDVNHTYSVSGSYVIYATVCDETRRLCQNQYTEVNV